MNRQDRVVGAGREFERYCAVGPLGAEVPLPAVELFAAGVEYQQPDVQRLGFVGAAPSRVGAESDRDPVIPQPEDVDDSALLVFGFALIGEEVRGRSERFEVDSYGGLGLFLGYCRRGRKESCGQCDASD